MEYLTLAESFALVFLRKLTDHKEQQEILNMLSGKSYDMAKSIIQESNNKNLKQNS